MQGVAPVPLDRQAYTAVPSAEPPFSGAPPPSAPQQETPSDFETIANAPQIVETAQRRTFNRGLCDCCNIGPERCLLVRKKEKLFFLFHTIIFFCFESGIFLCAVSGMLLNFFPFFYANGFSSIFLFNFYFR